MSPPPGSHSTTTGVPRALGHSAPKRMLAVVTASDPLSSANGITAILQLPGATRARLTWPPALAVLTAWTSAAGSWRETISPWVTWLVGVSTAVTTAATGDDDPDAGPRSQRRRRLPGLDQHRNHGLALSWHGASEVGGDQRRPGGERHRHGAPDDRALLASVNEVDATRALGDGGEAEVRRCEHVAHRHGVSEHQHLVLAADLGDTRCEPDSAAEDEQQPQDEHRHPQPARPRLQPR